MIWSIVTIYLSLKIFTATSKNCRQNCSRLHNTTLTYISTFKAKQTSTLRFQHWLQPSTFCYFLMMAQVEKGLLLLLLKYYYIQCFILLQNFQKFQIFSAGLLPRKAWVQLATYYYYNLLLLLLLLLQHYIKENSNLLNALFFCKNSSKFKFSKKFLKEIFSRASALFYSIRMFWWC